MTQIVRFAGRRNAIGKLYDFAKSNDSANVSDVSSSERILDLKVGEIILGTGVDSDSPYDGVLGFYAGQIYAEESSGIALPVIFLAKPVAGIVSEKRSFYVSENDNVVNNLLKNFDDIGFFYSLEKDKRGVLRFSPSKVFLGREEVLKGLENLLGPRRELHVVG